MQPKVFVQERESAERKHIAIIDYSRSSNSMNRTRLYQASQDWTCIHDAGALVRSRMLLCTLRACEAVVLSIPQQLRQPSPGLVHVICALADQCAPCGAPIVMIRKQAGKSIPRLPDPADYGPKNLRALLRTKHMIPRVSLANVRAIRTVVDTAALKDVLSKDFKRLGCLLSLADMFGVVCTHQAHCYEHSQCHRSHFLAVGSVLHTRTDFLH